MSSALTLRTLLRRGFIRRGIFIALALAGVGLGVSSGSWGLIVMATLFAAFFAATMLLNAWAFRGVSDEALDRPSDYPQPTLRWKPKKGTP